MSELKKDPTSLQDGVISVSDLTPQELAWYQKRVDFFESANVAAPTKMLLKILQEGRKSDC
jgi:hypothetical protein